MKRIVLPLAAIVVAGMILLFVLSSTTALRVDPPVRVVGTETPVRLQASNPHGIRRVTAWIEQDGQQHQVFEKAEPATRFFFFGRNEPAREITFSVGTKDAPSVKDGKAFASTKNPSDKPVLVPLEISRTGRMIRFKIVGRDLHGSVNTLRPFRWALHSYEGRLSSEWTDEIDDGVHRP